VLYGRHRSGWYAQLVRIPSYAEYRSKKQHESRPAVNEAQILSSPRGRFRAAMVLAMAADALQIVVFPLFAEGALSPVDDVLDVAVAAVLVHLLGWHWEFLPTLFAELTPGVDLVPFWTLAVANVYRKWKQITITDEETREQRPALPRSQDSSYARMSEDVQDGGLSAGI
jgi:hypothetical protein